MTSGEQKEQVKEAVDIVEIVSHYTQLSPSGHRLKGLSPFTNEKTPSFFVDPEQGIFYCFSSQKGGDVFTFVQEIEGVTFREALTTLAERVGISLTEHGGTKPSHAPLYEVLENATKHYKTALTEKERTYLTGRGISEQSIDVWDIGYAPDTWHTLCSTDMEKKESHLAAGLCAQKGASLYDRFRGRVIFPFRDVQGRVIGFSGRDVTGTSEAKYINSPETSIFFKSKFLFGLDKAKPAIRKNNVAMLMEGPVDTILAHQIGYGIAVSTSGTAVTATHLQLLAKLTGRLIIAFDGDAAGARATIKVIEQAFAQGIHCKVAVLPEGNDPADLIAKEVRAFKRAVVTALPAVKFLLHYVHRKYGEEGEDRLRGVRDIIFPTLLKLNDPLMQEYALEEIAQDCSVSKEAVQLAFSRVGKREPDLQPPRRVVQKITEDRVEQWATLYATAQAFLSSHEKEGDTTLSEKEEFIKKYVTLPEIPREVAKIRYEERGTSLAVQLQIAGLERDDMLNRLVPEMKKREQLRKQ